jgi:PAS domain S-box-containing protein
MAIVEGTGAIVPETADAHLVLERMDEGFYALDPHWRIVTCNRSAEAFWGKTRDRLLGHTMFELFPQFRDSAAHKAHDTAMTSGAPGTFETISTATGRPVLLKFFPSPAGLSVFFRDLSGRRALEMELKMRDELLSLAEESAGIGVWVTDLKAGTVVARPEFFRLLGVEPVEGPVTQDFIRSFRHPDDRERVTRGFQDALASGVDTYEVEYRIIRPSGEQRWIFGRGRVTRDADGVPWRNSGVDLDITERKKAEEHLRLVMGELLHRTNNLLAVVQGVARQSARRAEKFEDFIPAFGARLQGLGESGSLLARQDWRGAPLDALIRGQVAPFAEPSRFVLDGAPVLLSPKAAQNIGLALHELCTNALKYGALSVPGGRVRVSWAPIPEGLRLVWEEEGGPRVAPPTRTGFGRVVTEPMIEKALGAFVKTEFAPQGVRWTLDLPAEEFGPG